MGNRVLVTRNKLDLLADSISAKSGESLPLTIGEMKIAVDGIVLNSYTIGDGNLDVDENDYLYFDDDGTGIVPTGTITITANGTYNVTQYASAEVNISGSAIQTQTKTATPTESQQTISPDSGYLLSSVTVNAISSTYVGTGIDQNDSDDLTVSGATVTAPAGYYAESVSKSVASGTAGTPSATKGTVSNHQVSITPSVTNTTGYITGGTKTGTAVTVTASELASGNKEITSNGTNIDVIGYSTVSVDVPSSSTALISDTTDAAGGTIRTITTTDEVYLQTKTITPTSTQQTVLPDTGYDGFSSVIVGASSSGGSSSSYTRTVVASEQTVTPTSTTSNGYTYYSAQLNLTSGLESGEEYIITYNGTEYFYTCIVLWGTNYLLGEINYFYGTTGLPYPFGIIWMNGTTCTLACADSTAVTVKIEKLEFVGTPSATSHEIYFEFSDNTNTTITAYYDDSFIGSAITATTPTTYGQKTVTLAELDGVAWYEPWNIPLNTELVDYTTLLSDTIINSNGQAETEEWYYATDYINVATNMTFSYTAGRWTYLGLYDQNKTAIRVIELNNDGTVDSNDSNIVHGTLSGSKLPSNVAYARLSGSGNSSYHISLIRTA